MSNEVLRWIITLAVLAHGVGHILFMPLLSGTLRLQASGHSWLLTSVLGDSVVQVIASVAAAGIGVAFAAAGIGLAGQTNWWRGLIVLSAAASMALVVVMWSGIPTSSAFFALVFDAIVLGAVLIARWPSADTLGA